MVENGGIAVYQGLPTKIYLFQQKLVAKNEVDVTKRCVVTGFDCINL